jgi:uncharacterized Zn-finger protein
MSKKEMKFTVEFPTEKGFFGRECNNPECGKYFKVHEDSLDDEMYCPYCAESFQKEDLLTKDQTNYAKEVTKEKVEQMVHEDLQNIFKKASKNSKFLEYKSSKRRKKNIRPKYKEKKIDSEFICPYCDCNFQVYGVFGYCPGCKKENILIYDANATSILQEINDSKNKERSLRHAYSDIVSTFEIFCKNKAKKVTSETTNFQDIYKTRRFFKKHLETDILEDLTNDQELTFKRIFHKRHVYDHNDGIISEKYAIKIPEDKDKVGKKAKLNIEEFKTGTEVIRQVLTKIINKVH